MIKILPPITNFKNNILSSYKEISESQQYAREIGLRAAGINKAENADKFIRASRIKQAGKKVTPFNLPILGFIAGLIIPIPFLNPILTLAGLIAGAGLYLYQKLHNA